MRPRCRRRVGFSFRETYFKPRGISLRELDEISITDEDLETLRLRYILNIEQEDAAKKMGISQSQYQRDLSAAMKKITRALVEGSAIRVIKTKTN
jgi:uncharacterized protein